MGRLLVAIISVIIAGAVALGSTIAYVEAKYATNQRVNYVEKDVKSTKEDIKDINSKLDRMYICMLTKECK